MKKSSSFFTRLFFGNFLIVVIIVALGGFLAYRYLGDHYLAASRAAQRRLTLAWAHHLEATWPMERHALQKLAGDYLRTDLAAAADDPDTEWSRVRLTVIAAGGRVLADNKVVTESKSISEQITDVNQMENHKTEDRPEVMAALAGGFEVGRRTSETFGTPYRYMAFPVRHEGRVVAAARTAVPAQRIAKHSLFIRRVLFWASLAAIVAGILLGLFINWIWYAPLRRITMAARQIASGNLSGRARISGSDELAQLGKALNAMRDNLAHQIDVVSSQRGNLRTVVRNLQEGVIALDAEGRIVLTNQAALDLCAADEIEPRGRHLQDAIRIVDVVDAYDESVASGEAVDKQIDVDHHATRLVLDVHVAPVSMETSSEIRTLIVVHDVTDLARTAAMKAEFVANASHELRTPLATIRAAVDSLQGMAEDPKALDKFGAILDRHVARLENLTMDLLDLHIVEGSRKPLDLRPVGLGSLAEWIRSNFALKAEQRNIDLALDVAEASREFVTGRKLLELILHNLVDNAVKFTPAGGRVEVRIEPRDQKVLFQVTDTGCGIPLQEQPRVFERFYQADTSRSGDTRVRGTGLGLAIVKHASDRLDATIELVSKVGEGTTVSVLVPEAEG